MIAVNVLVLFALVFLLAGNCFLFLRYRAAIDLAEDVLAHLERVRKERDDTEKTIAAIHEMYQRELYNQRKLFAKYYGEKKSEGMDETPRRYH